MATNPNDKENPKSIGYIGNYYGCLSVAQENDKYYWSIENWDGHHWEEITKELYDALMKFESDKEVKP